MLLGLHQRRGGQLPAEVTSFVGRETELARISTLLRTSRLVTITGTGGVGKTRVALHAARQVAGSYADGARLAELSGLRDPALLPSVVAAALGLAEQDAPTDTGTLASLLRDRRMLLILDTCEHLVDACAVLAEAVMRDAPGVTLLATSRQPLDVPGESTCMIPPLHTPAPAAAGTPGEAADLFAERAAAAVPGFAVTAENLQDVTRLCQRLDGIPLAIELAAVRLRALPLHELANGADGRFHLLTSGRRGTLDRHQSLHSAIAWSYDLCTPAERTVWARLSVFAGAFDFTAAQEVCADEELTGEQVIETIVHLVDKSVLIREPARPPAGSEAMRYRLLDTMREFGAQKLAASGTAPAIRARHVARYLRMARAFGDHVLDDDQLERYRAFRDDHANLSAALEYALDGQPDPRVERDGAELAAALSDYWQVSGLLRDGVSWLTKAAGRSPSRSRERAMALLARSYLAASGGQPEDAVADVIAATHPAAELHDDALIARGYLRLTLVLTCAGRFEEAAAAGAEAGRRLEALHDRAGLAALDVQLAHLANCTGNHAAALAYVRQGLRRLGPGERFLHGRLHTAAAVAMLAQTGMERECADEIGAALRAKYELGDEPGIAVALEVHAWLAARTGRPQRAAWLLGAAAAQWEKVGGHLAGVAGGLAGLHRQAEDAARAALGGARFDTMRHQGSQHPLDQVVALTSDGADELSEPPAAPPARSLGMLTKRERQIATLVATSLSNREIAERMVISKRTVDAHVEHIFAKLGLKSRVQLAIWLRECRP